MTTLSSLIVELKRYRKTIQARAQLALDKEVFSLIDDFRLRSPVDTGDYRKGWRRKISKFSDALAGALIVNEDPKAALMEYGAEPRSAPWYFPSSKAPTGKLTESQGRIWAGGLNPGHYFTVGGAIDPVLYRNEQRQLKIANAVASSVMRGL